MNPIDIWGYLTPERRREVERWLEILDVFSCATNKAQAVAALVRDHEPWVRGISRTSIYRYAREYKEHGMMALLTKYERSHIAHAEGGGLPDGFIKFWQGLCGQNQRGKCASAYRALIRELTSGAVIPGYGKSWQDIWRDERANEPVPTSCPVYSRILQFPRGWGYRNLMRHKPKSDVMAGATMGAWALQQHLPSVPRTRVGIPFGKYFVVDDVQHDNKVLFMDSAKSDRPLELAVLELKTANYVTWGCTPTQRRSDGTRIMLKEQDMLYLLADLLCRVGVNSTGIVILAEHGTAVLRADLVERVNREIQTITGISEFIRVETGKVFGKPILNGMYEERRRGLPRFKAAIESSWNLLHNELAALPGQIGKDRDHSPQSMLGVEKEDAELMRMCQAIVKQYGSACTSLIRFNQCGYFDFVNILKQVKSHIASRTDHHLEGWEGLGFTKQVFAYAGQEIDVDEFALCHTAEETEQMVALLKVSHAPSMMKRLSPAEAYAKCEKRESLIKLPMSVAAVILAEKCGKRAKVTERGELLCRDEYDGRTVRVWNAIVNDSKGYPIALDRGTEYIVVNNPFAPDTIMVLDKSMRYVGHNTQCYEAAQFGDEAQMCRNLALWQQAKAEATERLKVVMQPQRKARAELLQSNATTLLSMNTLQPLESANVEMLASEYDDDITFEI